MKKKAIDNPIRLTAASPEYGEQSADCGTLNFGDGLTDLPGAEAAEFDSRQKNPTAPECFLQQDDLCNPYRQCFWYADPYMRVCIDMDRGGAIVDLRPRIAGSEHAGDPGEFHGSAVDEAFLIREVRQADGIAAELGAGTLRSARLCRNGEELDLCHSRTKAAFNREGEDRVLTLDPVELEFSDGFRASIQTVITFAEGSASIRYDKRVLSLSDPAAEITVKEYLAACCGTAQSRPDASGVILQIEAGEEDSVAILCEGQGREARVEDAEEASCTLRPIKTRAVMLANGRRKTAFVQENRGSGSVFAIGWERKLREQDCFTTWLNLERAD